MKFLFIIPLLVILVATQDDLENRTVAHIVIGFLKQQASLPPNERAAGEMFDETFVFRGCNGTVHSRAEVLEVVHTSTDPVDIEMETASSRLDGRLLTYTFNVNVNAYGRKFKAVALVGPFSFSISSVNVTDCPN